MLVLFSRYIITQYLYSMEIEKEVKKDEGSSGAIEETEVDEMKKYVSNSVFVIHYRWDLMF